MAWFSNLLHKKEVPARYKIPLTLHNTLGDADQIFDKPSGRKVTMYNCGPTVYGPAHIGNLRSYIFADTLRRALEYNGYNVKQVINITDVGHLTSDQDSGEDKMSKGLRREGMELTLANMKTLAEKYAELFISEIKLLNISTEDTEFPRASDYIDAQVAMIKTLEEKGYAYKISDGVYFDTSRFPTYGELGNIDLEAQKEGARVEINPEKHNPADFNLWKLDKNLGWESPWGQGFPGWHIECSAMTRAILGEQIDIHTGGIDHIPVHHNNEIAQSESVTGKKPFSRFWLHNAFITINNDKIAKSAGNDIVLENLKEKNIHPLALRYFYLGAQYHSQINFSWEAIEAAQKALLRLHFLFSQLDSSEASVSNKYKDRFHKLINNNLDTPGAIALMWEMTKDTSLPSNIMRATLIDFDAVLGLSLGKPDEKILSLIKSEFGEAVEEDSIPDSTKKLLAEREDARKKKDWQKADSIRDEIHSLGYEIEDTPDGARILQK